MKNRLKKLLIASFLLAYVSSTTLTAEAKIYMPTEDYQIHTVKNDLIEDAAYNVLFIGNSITIHPACNYWWGNWGMAASSADKDYVHQVVEGLEKTYQTVDYDILSFSIWERKEVRSNILPYISDVMSNNYNLVVIQLGDNVSSIKGFENDYETLVAYVKAAQPNAEIVLVGDYWYKKGRDAKKIAVAKRQGAKYIDLSDFRKSPEFHAKDGDMVMGEDGQLHSIDFHPVALHPNDLGMKLISDKILLSFE